LRFDDIAFEDALTGLERSDSQASPTVGVVVTPREGFSVYLSRSSRVPQL
jgi:outer membrane receptor protein involved in Fe transport